MKNILSFFASTLLIFPLFSQDIQEISTGQGYKKQSFVNLATKTQTQADDTSWDIAFTVFGLQDAGVFVNESSGSSMGQPLPLVEAYWTIFDDFNIEIDPTAFTDEMLIHNDEASWNYGAFNQDRDPANPFDFGWGTYNPVTNSVAGNDVFVLKLRNGNFLKFKIESLAGTTYSLRYANLDGSNEKTATINKADHAGKTLAYFNFTTGTTANIEPATGFDLFYCRYITSLYDPGTMGSINYNVTGILSGRGVTVAKALNVDPTTVQFADYQDSMQVRLDVIGHDWKSFSGTAWSIDDARVYFVKTQNSRVFKLHFIDFEGSTTGTAVFETTDLGTFSSIDELPGSVSGFEVFPNPASTEANVLLDLKTKPSSGEGFLKMTDAAGKTVFENRVPLQNGLNGFVLPLAELSAGVYFFSLNFGGELVSQSILKL